MPYGCQGSTLEKSCERPILKIEPSDAEHLHNGCCDQFEAIAEMLADANGRFCEVVNTYEWENFTKEQRISFVHMHEGIRNAQIHLRNPNGI